MNKKAYYKLCNGTKRNENLLSNAVSRLCKMAAADTILNNAERDGAQFAWIPSGDSCAFCFMLASNGWQYISKKSRKDGHAEHIHANCDCTCAIRFSSKDNVEGYDPDAMREEYYAKGGTNGLRRKIYQQNKEKINERKHANYAKSVEKTRKSDRITPTKIVSGHDGTPKESNPDDVIDHVDYSGKVDARTIYGSDGFKHVDIHTNNHGNPKTHPYGENGEHAHEYKWNQDGKLKEKKIRDLSPEERKEHSDII